MFNVSFKFKFYCLWLGGELPRYGENELREIFANEKGQRKPVR